MPNHNKSFNKFLLLLIIAGIPLSVTAFGLSRMQPVRELETKGLLWNTK